MIIFTIALSERLAKYGEREFVRQRLGTDVDFKSRNLCQRIGKYEMLIMDTRSVPLTVELGASAGITGEDWLCDYKLGNPGTKLRTIEKLPFGHATVVAFRNPETIDERIRRVASPYENIALDYLRKIYIVADFYPLRGKTESWTKSMMRLADLGIDNKNSGKTIDETRLIITDKIMDSQAILIAKEENIDEVKNIFQIESLYSGLQKLYEYGKITDEKYQRAMEDSKGLPG